MFRVAHIRLTALALGLTGLTACQKRDPGAANNAEDPSRDKADAEPRNATSDDQGSNARPTAPPDGDVAEAAYFGILGQGIAKLDDSGWSMLFEDSVTIVSSMFFGPDGTPYVLKLEGLFAIRDSKLEQIVEFDRSFSSASSMAVAKDGSFWAPGFEGVGLYRDGKWTMLNNEEIDSKVHTFLSVTIGADGIPWFHSATDYGFYYRQGESWKKADLSAFDSHHLFGGPLASPSGEVYASTGQELARLQPGGIEKITIDSTGNLRGHNAHMAYGPDGSILLASTACDLAVVHPDRPDQVRQINGDSYDCTHLTSSGLDGQGRAWVSSREGLSVVAADGTVTEYPMGSVPELIGLSTHMMVVGAGPKRLPKAGPVQTGPITGKVLLDRQPVAGAEIEMCTSPEVRAATSPCANARVKFAGTTNDKGEFTFDQVPLGDFNIAVKFDIGWRFAKPASHADKRKPGEPYDIEVVKFVASPEL